MKTFRFFAGATIQALIIAALVLGHVTNLKLVGEAFVFLPLLWVLSLFLLIKD